jgi:hypothetical protein
VQQCVDEDDHYAEALEEFVQARHGGAQWIVRATITTARLARRRSG